MNTGPFDNHTQIQTVPVFRWLLYSDRDYIPRTWSKSSLVLISGTGDATQIDPDAMTQAFRGKDQSDNEEEHETGLVMDTQSEAPTQVHLGSGHLKNGCF